MDRTQKLYGLYWIFSHSQNLGIFPVQLVLEIMYTLLGVKLFCDRQSHAELFRFQKIYESPVVRNVFVVSPLAYSGH